MRFRVARWLFFTWDHTHLGYSWQSKVSRVLLRRYQRELARRLR
jgi:hypothetical protein